MKYIISIFLFVSHNLWTQINYCITSQVATDNTPAPCCNANINTDYNFPFNPERLDLVNQFNWLTPATTSTGSATIPINRNSAVVNIDHPFLNDIASKYWWYSNYRIGDQAPFLNNTMHPKYGWQLLYHNFGFNIFTTTPSSNVPAAFNPIMIYYNKYTGKMRIFASPGNGNSFDESSVKLGFITNTTLFPSALLSHNTEIAKALDQKTEIAMITASMPFATVNSWAGGDIQTTYDPCVCKNESRLLFNFFDRDFSSVYMSGNIVGINRPLDNSGSSPLKFGENFISSVYTDYTNNPNKNRPRSGMLVYNDIGNTSANAYISPNMKGLIGAMDFLSSISGDFSENMFNTTLGKGLTKAIGKGLGFASKQLNSPTPQISFLEAQGAFSGEINNQSNSGGYSSFEILNPGSFHNFRKTTPWNIQPLYNESLGLFALLKTPKIIYNIVHQNVVDGTPADPYDNKMRALAMTIDEPLQFLLNPSSDIDLDKTQIHSTIEFDLYDEWNMPIKVLNLANNLVDAKEYFKPSFNQLSPDDPYEHMYDPSSNWANDLVEVQSQKRVFSTYAMPINKLHNVTFLTKFNGGTFKCWDHSGAIQNSPWNPKFRLRIYVDYTFKPNQYGEVNKTTQTYLYDLEVTKDFNYQDMGFPCSISSNIFCTKKSIAANLGLDLTINSTNYSSNQIIYGNNVTINGNLTTSNNATVTILYRGSVTINPSSVISPNIIIKYNDFDVHDKLIMPSEKYLREEFCANSYKANQLKSVTNGTKNNPISKQVTKNTTILSLHPNPAQFNTTLRIENPTSEKALIKVYDLVGREVMSQEAMDIATSKNEVELKTEVLQRGLYIVKVYHGETEQSLKLEIQK